MEDVGEQEKLEILLNKVKLYLTFSLSFVAISFPLISLSDPIPIQEISEIIIIIISNLLLIISLLLFVSSLIFSLYTFNGLNSLKVNKKSKITIKGISFYSAFIEASNYLNITGFFLIVLYISLIITNNIFLMFGTAGTIIFSVIVFKTLKHHYLNSKDS